MNKKLILLLVCLCGIIPFAAQAGGLPPWFRGSKEMWQLIVNKSFTPQRVLTLSIEKPFSLAPSSLHVKTNVGNWLKYRTAYSHALNSAEKQTLQKFPDNSLATSGKLTYFYDRDQLLLSTFQELFPTGTWSEKSFDRHQAILSLTRQEVEAYTKNSFFQHLSPWMNRDNLEYLLLTPQQPASYALDHQELLHFATLSLPEQQAFAKQKLTQTQEQLSRYLSADPQKLTTSDFSGYYILKLRLDYFKLLDTILLRAEKPRSSLVLRLKQTLDLPFLPNAQEKLTDAQRLGKLAFYQAQPHLFSARENALLTQVLEQQYHLYIFYAEAEAFHVPYHRILSIYGKQLNAVDIFGPEGAAKIEHMSSQELLERIPQVQQKIDLSLQQLRQLAEPTPQTYTEYFRMKRKKLFYEHLYSHHDLKNLKLPRRK